MEAQDEFNNILVGLYPDNQKTTFGALCYHGAMSMIDDYGADGEYEADAWTVFGDPSVQVRTDIPATMEVIHEEFVLNGAESFEVEVTGVPNALCAISADGVLLGNGYTDQTGHAIIEFFTPINTAGEVQLVVTGFNKIPYMATLLAGEPNLPPEKPAKPTGRASGEPGKTYLYSTTTTDPDGDGILYQWDWGNGNFSEWVGPYASGNSISTQHSWSEKGTYSIRVKAKDIQGHESSWSDPLDITMPYNLPFLARLITLLETFFPHLFYFLENIAQN